MQTGVRSRLSIIAATVAGTMLIGGMASAIEFSADQSMSMMGMSMNGKVYVKGLKQRIEQTTPMGKTIRIVRPDKGVAWMLNPTTKSYMEVTGPKTSKMPSIVEALKAQTGAKKVGSEKANGYMCDKYKMSQTMKGPNGSSTKIEATIWLNAKFPLPVKSVATTPMGQQTSELKNIKEKPQPDSLFELPAGYKKQAMPSGAGGMMPGMGGGRAPGGMPGGMRHK